MAAPTSKRKRDDDGSDHSEDEAVLRARFQRAFEAKFKPLAVETKSLPAEDVADDEEDEDESDGSEWDGLPDDQGEVQVVDHGEDASYDARVLAAEKKAFMSSKPPSLTNKTNNLLKSATDTAADEPEEAANLKNDLALQRLLKESHLLDPTTFADRPSALEGKNRRKALDLRLKDLGAKDSISVQEKMPLSHRKGIVSKSISREEKRRREATENGIVLEKARMTAKAGKPRERSIVGPTVGKFRGGTLKLNSRDLKSVQGPELGVSVGRKGRRK